VKHRLLVTAISLIAALGAAEIAARVLVARGVLVYRPFRVTQNPAFWSYRNPAFGVWHAPNATFHHVTSCFDATYRTNSAGARDRERAVHAPLPRDVVLGDSFIEGWGMRDGERLTDRLEASTGREYLNFATGGGFGTVQELVLYRTLASRYDHSGVLLFVLPANDFADNDPKMSPPRTFRPYLRHGDAGAEIYYTVKFEDRDMDVLPRRTIALNTISNASYLLDVARQLRAGSILRASSGASKPPEASYDAATEADIAMMSDAISELARAAGSRPVGVFVIPLETDLEKYGDAAVEPPLIRTLRERLRSNATVHVRDLRPAYLSYMRQHGVRASAFYLPCDFHWSALGNAVAADAVQP
jgi:hypothetical protein